MQPNALQYLQQQSQMQTPIPQSPNALDYLSKKKENLFDFSSVQQQQPKTNNIQEFLGNTKGKKEWESKRNAVIEMLKNQEEDDFVINAISQMGYKGFTSPEGVGDFLKDRFTGSKDIAGNIFEGIVQAPSDVVNIGLATVGSERRVPSLLNIGEEGAEQKKGLLARSASTIAQRGKEIMDIPKQDQTFLEDVGQGTMKVARAGLDIFGDAFMTTLSTLTPDQQKAQLTSALQSVADTQGGEAVMQAAQDIGTKYSEFAKENPRAIRNLEAVATGIDGALELVGAGAGKKLVTKGAEKALDIASTSGKKLSGVVGKIQDKKLAKELLKKDENLKKQIGKVIQGETDDIKPAIKTFKIIDTKGVKTYKDLSNKIEEKQKNILKNQDNLLQEDGRKFGLENTKKTIKTPLGDIESNYVSNSLGDIKREIEEVGSFDDYNQKLFGKDKTLGDVIVRIGSGDASLEDLNDFARYYNGNFRDKMYTKTGDPKDSVKAGRYETNRKGIKEFVRDQLPTDELKQFDLQYSNIADTKILIKKVTEGVNKLEQKIKERGLLEKGARGIAKGIDILSFGTVRGFLTGFLPSNIGNKINNFIDIQNDLGKRLKEINKLLEKKDLNIKDIQNITKKQLGTGKKTPGAKQPEFSGDQKIGEQTKTKPVEKKTSKPKTNKSLKK